MSKKKQTELFTASQDLQSQIVAKYPAIFDKDAPVPVAVGIRDQIKAALPDADEKALGLMLRIWCTRLSYHASVIADGSVRRNLDGSEQRPVTDDERQHSIKAMASIQENIKAKRLAKLQPVAELVAKVEAVAKKAAPKREIRGNGPLARAGAKGAKSK